MKSTAPGRDRAGTIRDLLRSRANLHHLIYFMEHDRSLGAAASKIGVLRQMLDGIEKQIVTRRHIRSRPQV